jgi:ERCC4-type nuclease
MVFRNKETSQDILLFERKTLADLLASIKDGRYEEQSHRIIHTSQLHPHNVVYILEGSLVGLRSPGDKRVVQSAMTSLMYFKGFSVVRTVNVQETAELIWSMCTKLEKEFGKGKPVMRLLEGGAEAAVAPAAAAAEPVSSYSQFVKKTKHENITPENIGEIILCQVPGISSTSAAELMRHYGGSLYNLLEDINEHPERLQTIYFSTAGGKRRKIGSNIVENLQKYLRKSKTEGTDSQITPSSI